MSSRSLNSSVVCVLLLAGSARADLSSTAYRVLGQPDVRQNGINRVQGVEMQQPQALALDPLPGHPYLYVADLQNHRVLGWKDKQAFQNGDAPDLLLGQPNGTASRPMGLGVKGFNYPAAVAVDPATGNLYVADSGNNRILRFASPFENPARLEPDAVYGQPDLKNIVLLAPSQVSLRGPRSLAFDSSGNLWVADTGFHRLVRYPAGTLDSVAPVPDVVVGQSDFVSVAPNRGGKVAGNGFDTPTGLAFDSQNNLYVSDFNNARVLKFAPNPGPDATAPVVYGQQNSTARILPSQAAATSVGGPAGLCVDAAGNLYVAVPAENRVLVFSASASGTQTAKLVYGQSDFSTSRPNSGAFPKASANTLSGPMDVKTDAQGNLFIADAGNNRVLAYSPNSRSASRVLGQIDLSSNGVNQVKAGGLNSPYKIAVDYSQSPFALYVSDTGNHRILMWKDAARFRSGDPADAVIGQPDLRSAFPNGDSGLVGKPSATSLSFPKGIAVDARGNLYVADSGNNRVLRYPRPASQSVRITPDMVMGQRDFSSAESTPIGAASLNSPSAVALGPDGDIFVSDTGNNRVLAFPAAANTAGSAMRVFGQPDFYSGTAPAAVSPQTLSAPQGIAVDAFSDLFVADSGSNRVVAFLNTRDAPSSGAAAAMVFGANGFNAALGGATGAASFRTPSDVAVDSDIRIYVADSGNHRVLVFPSLIFLPNAGAAASMVIGQKDFVSNTPNWNSQDGLATGDGLWTPLGLLVDRRDTLYVADSGNSRVAHFLNDAALVHAANPQASAVGVGAMASLQGSGFVGSDATGSAPFPTSLLNRELVINDQLPVPLAAVRSDSVTFQVPWLAPTGLARFVLRAADTGELIAGTSSPISSFAPELFTADGKQGAILNEDGTPNTTATPAARGTTIRLKGTGQGPVSPYLADGQAAPADPPVVTLALPVSDGKTCLAQQPSVCVAIGSSFGEIKFSGLAAGQVGIWQVDVKIPVGASVGPVVPLRVIIGGVLSNLVNISIK